MNWNSEAIKRRARQEHIEDTATSIFCAVVIILTIACMLYR